MGRRGEKAGERKRKGKGGKGQRVKVGGVCLSGCGTVIQLRGVAVVFLIEIQQMWETWGEGGEGRKREGERERFPPTQQEDTLLKQQARQSESQKEAGCQGSSSSSSSSNRDTN